MSDNVSLTLTLTDRELDTVVAGLGARHERMARFSALAAEPVNAQWFDGEASFARDLTLRIVGLAKANAT